MDKMKKACEQSCEDWVNIFEETDDYAFSPSFEKDMEGLQDEMSHKKHHKPSRKTARFLINAAVILCFCAAVFVIPPVRERTVGIFKGFVDNAGISSGGEDAVTDDRMHSGLMGAGEPDIGFDFGSVFGEKIELTLGYVPNGFEMLQSYNGGDNCTEIYANDSDDFMITKVIGDLEYNYNVGEVVRINDVDYIVRHEETKTIIFWYKDSYSYRLEGNIDKEELLKIAANAY